MFSSPQPFNGYFINHRSSHKVKGRVTLRSFNFLVFALWKAQLLSVASDAVAPVLYHTSVEGNAAWYCHLLVEAVDSYALVILTLFLVGALILLKNLLLKVLSFSKTEYRVLNEQSKITQPLKSVHNFFLTAKAFFSSK